MKVLLINPPNDLKEVIGGGSYFVPTIEPLGLLYIAAVCRDAGYEVLVIDAHAEKLCDEELLARIDKIRPDVTGFTSFTSNGGFLYEFGKKIKTMFPEMLVIFGNTHASVYAEQYLRNNCCDIVVHGEGEYTFLELLKHKEAKQTLKNIKSISFIDKNQFVTTPGPGIVEDLSVLPMPARDLVNKELYSIGPISNFSLKVGEKSSVSKHMFTARGCCNECYFCAVHNSKIQRFNSVSRVLEEIEMLLSHFNAGYIFIMDSLFISNKGRVLEICREIKKRRLIFSWGCEAHINYLDLDLIKEMESAGCIDINVGIESGVQSLLNRVNKNINIDDIENKLNMVKKNTGINIMGLFILGLPGETRENSLETINFAKKLPLDMAQFSVLVPYPGSPLFNDLKNKNEIDTGIKNDGTIDTSVWKRYSSYISYINEDLIWVTKEQTSDSLKNLQKKAFRSFYFRPHVFWKQLKRVRPSNLFSVLKAFIDTFIC